MNTPGVVVEVLAASALLSGGALTVVAGFGLLRLPDVAARLQAGTKPHVLGLLLICLGTAPLVSGPTQWAIGLVALFQLTTAPGLAQIVGRAAYRSGAGRDALVLDELEGRGEQQEPPR